MKQLLNRTIVAHATPPGRSSIAVLRLSGSEALLIADRIFQKGPLPKAAALSNSASSSEGEDLQFLEGGHLGTCQKKEATLEKSKGYRAYFGYVHEVDKPLQPIDQAVALVFRAPHSYTGEDVVEFSLHGGLLLRERFLEACLAAGAEQARPGEFTKRAVLNGRMLLSEAEAVADLIDAATERSAVTALYHLTGALAEQLQKIRQPLYTALAAWNVSIEFPEHDSAEPHKAPMQEALATALQRVTSLLDTYRQGRLLRDGFQLLLAGAPNAGKSSLFNALLGQNRALVSDIAGTTRDRISETLDWYGIPILLHDTAGLRELSHDPIEKMGMEQTNALIQQADAVLWLLEPAQAIWPDPSCLQTLKPGCVWQFVWTKQDIYSQSPDEQEACPEKIHEWLIAQEQIILPPISLSSRRSEDLQQIKDIVHAHYNRLAPQGGLGDLTHSPSEKHQGAKSGSWSPLLLRTPRQAQLLSDAQEALKMGLEGLEQNWPEDLLSAQVNRALQALTELDGESSSEGMLNELFSRFCVGK